MFALSRVLRLTKRQAFLAYVVLDVFATGAGMGVPFFNIMVGFFLGWYIVRWTSAGTREVRQILRQLLRYASIAAAVTLLAMATIWGWSVGLLFDPKADLAKFGIPQILFKPRASFIGWLVLMIVISPFLQLLTTMFAGHVTLLYGHNSGTSAHESATATA